MTAKTAAQRQAEKRERDRMKEGERLARLLSRRISLNLYKSTDMALIRTMARLGIDEPQDVIQRLIHGSDRLDDESLTELTSY